MFFLFSINIAILIYILSKSKEIMTNLPFSRVLKVFFHWRACVHTRMKICALDVHLKKRKIERKYFKENYYR